MYTEIQNLELSKFRILIADDEKNVTDALERMLKNSWGCSVKCVYDGDSVISELKNGLLGKPYEILITDMIMPGTSGLDLIHKALEINPELAILVITANKNKFSFMDIVKAGAHDILIKPFSKDELQAKLFRVLREIHYIYSCKSAEKRYKDILDLSTDGIIIIDPRDGIISGTNQSLSKLLGYDGKEIVGKSIVDILSPNERERFSRWYEIFINENRGTLSDVEIFRKDESPIYCDISGIYLRTDTTDNIFFTLKDVTEQKQIENYLIEAARKDELTSLFNRRSFDMQIEWAVKSAEENYSNYALQMIDIDNFKNCNDTYGHAIGDQVLRNLGEIIPKSIRNLDSGFRFGGDEFAVILCGADSSISIIVAKRIQSYFNKIDNYGTSLSIGIAQFRMGMTAQEFVHLADNALYEAKRQGKNTIFCINPDDKVEIFSEIF